MSNTKKRKEPTISTKVVDNNLFIVYLDEVVEIGKIVREGKTWVFKPAPDESFSMFILSKIRLELMYITRAFKRYE